MSPIQHAARTARSGQEMLAASGDVISRRLEIAAEAVCNPLHADYAELALMGSEKVEALSASAAVTFTGAIAVAEAMNRLMVRQGEAAHDAIRHLARCGTPASALEVQGRWAIGLWDRSLRDGWALGAALLELQADALAPIHEAATANARRLRRPPCADTPS